MSSPAGVWILQLTNSQKIALVDLILEHMLAASCSEQFVDLSTPEGIVTRPRDLLILLDQAGWISQEKVEALQRLANFAKLIPAGNPTAAKS